MKFANRSTNGNAQPIRELHSLGFLKTYSGQETYYKFLCQYLRGQPIIKEITFTALRGICLIKGRIILFAAFICILSTQRFIIAIWLHWVEHWIKELVEY